MTGTATRHSCANRSGLSEDQSSGTRLRRRRSVPSSRSKTSQPFRYCGSIRWARAGGVSTCHTRQRTPSVSANSISPTAAPPSIITSRISASSPPRASRGDEQASSVPTVGCVTQFRRASSLADHGRARLSANRNEAPCDDRPHGLEIEADHTSSSRAGIARMYAQADVGARLALLRCRPHLTNVGGLRRTAGFGRRSLPKPAVNHEPWTVSGSRFNARRRRAQCAPTVSRRGDAPPTSSSMRCAR